MTKQEFVDQLSKLVAFRTLTGDVHENAQALAYIESLLSSKALVERVKNKDAEILLASNKPGKTPDFGYMVHVDVVAASDGLFIMRQEGSQVFGRGVSDMKFSIPIGVALLNELIETDSPLHFTLAITTDEEVGGFDGAAFLAEEMKFRPKTLIVPDGGDNLKFVNASKGIVQFAVTATGKSAHASRTWEGKNAIAPLAQLIVSLQDKYGKQSQTESWKTTLNFGQIHGGISTNQVCDAATVHLDFRYPETDTQERIENEVRQLAKDIDPEITVQTLSTGLPTFTDESLPIVQRFLSVLSDACGVEIPVKPTYGGSDARHFAPFDIPVLMIKPMGGDIHMESEFLDVDSTMQFYQGLQEFLRQESELL